MSVKGISSEYSAKLYSGFIALVHIWYLFMIVSLFGYIIEYIFRVQIMDGRKNFGFLETLPMIPIYGVGVLVVLALRKPITKVTNSISNRINLNKVYIEVSIYFIVICLCAVLIEYLTASFFLNVFDVRFWNYTKYPLNYKGYVCVSHTIAFGVMGTLVLYFFLEKAQNVINKYDNILILIVGVITFTIFLLDIIKSFKAI